MVYLNRSISKFSTWQILTATGALLLVGIGAFSILKSSLTITPSSTELLTDFSGSSPSVLAKLPGDLKNPALQYSGIYEDGWLSESPSLFLTQPSDANALVIRGSVPTLGNPAFSSQVGVNVDNQLVGGENLGVGDFELLLPLPEGAGLRQIQISFSQKQFLTAGDGRPIGALLKYIGFEARTDLVLKLPRDIAGKEISLGTGWYLPEESDELVYRWVNNQAEFTVSSPDDGDLQALHLELEPGPGLDLKPFELKFLNLADRIVAQRTVTGRQTLKVLLPTEPGTSSVYKLSVDGGGKPVPGENRILNFRVFRAKLGEAPPDIYSPKEGLALGTGWFDPETSRGKAFRWVNNDAEFSVTAPLDNSIPLTVELEPGPGANSQPLELQLLSATGKVVNKATVSAREQLKFRLPTLPGKTETYKLHALGGGKTTAGDPRILNFRVFDLKMGASNKPDIVPPRAVTAEAANLEIGENWYAVENQDGQLYRWVNNDAELLVRMPQKGKTPVLVLELESGPGLERKPFVIQARNAAGLLITQASAKEAGFVNLTLPYPPGHTEAIKLHVDGGGRVVPNEKRILNFRIFKARLGQPVDVSTRRNLLKTGMYEDGWVTTKSLFQIPQLKNPAMLTVRGVIPMVTNKAFSTELRVLVDNQEITRKTIYPGDFEIQMPPPPGAGNRQISLLFSKSQALPGEDQRLVAGLLRYVGFDAPPKTDVASDPNQEIPLPLDSVVLGEGWYPVEVQQGVLFRWVSNNAELRLTPPIPNTQSSLNLMLEPGPGVGSQPFELRLLDAQKKLISAVTVRGKETIRFSLPATSSKTKLLYFLQAKNGGKATPNDLRTLNFRVFNIEWSKP